MQDDARKKLEELQQAGDDAWEDLKAGIDSAWDSLSSSVKSAFSRAALQTPAPLKTEG